MNIVAHRNRQHETCSGNGFVLLRAEEGSELTFVAHLSHTTASSGRSHTQSWDPARAGDITGLVKEMAVVACRDGRQL